MQPFKEDFLIPDKTRYASLQSCIRTNDIELVGDGSHLTYFQMLGNFSFGGEDYHKSVEMWNCILRDLQIPVTHITIHPDRKDHHDLWKPYGYPIVLDPSCEWSDGNIGGNCCEVFVKDLEIGNLVNPLGHSVDVGFGLERLLQVVDGKSRVDQTELFRQDVHPVVADHYRTLLSFRENGIKPGVNGREFICRKIIRRMLQHPEDIKKLTEFREVFEHERTLMNAKYDNAKRFWKRNKNKPDSFWSQSYGLTPEEIVTLKKEVDSGVPRLEAQ